MTVQRDIEIVQGQTWTELFLVDGLVSTGNGLRMHLRDHHGATLLRAALAHDNAANERISFATGGVLANLGASISTAWDLQGQPVRRWVYSIERYSLSDVDDVTVLFAGTAIVKSNPTDESSITPVAPHPSYDESCVRFDVEQTLTEPQKTRARDNIGVGAGGALVEWGGIGGDLADQDDLAVALADLESAIAGKADSGHTHSDATGSAAGFMTAAAKTKLDGIATGATANASDADLRARSSHTGTQLAATISDFTSAAAAAAPVQSVAGRTGAVVIAVADVSGAESTANKAQPSGYASLDSSGKVPQAQIPAIAITEYLGDVASQAAMLALSGQKGDWCTRSDTGATWIITGTDPTLLGSWTSVTYPTSPVTSVAGRTGAVTISSTDITDSTSAGRAVLTAANAAAIRTAAGVVIGTDVQAYSATLAATTASFLLADETKLDAIEALADVTDAGNVGSAINGATEKTTPTGADKIPILDSAAASVLKWMSWTSITTALNALYATVGRTISAAGLATGGGDLSANRTITVTAASTATTEAWSSTSEALTPGGLKNAAPPYVEWGASADKTLALTDSNVDQWCNNGATARVLNIPANASVAFSIGTCIPGIRLGSGTCTVDAPTGVTLNGVDGGSCTVSTQGQGYLLTKTGTNAWWITGDRSAVA